MTSNYSIGPHRTPNKTLNGGIYGGKGGNSRTAVFVKTFVTPQCNFCSASPGLFFCDKTFHRQYQ